MGAQIAGLRRYRLSRSPDSPDILAIQLIENINRENVAILEEAEAVARLVDELGKRRMPRRPWQACGMGFAAAQDCQRLYLVQPVVDSGATRDPETFGDADRLGQSRREPVRDVLRKNQISRAGGPPGA